PLADGPPGRPPHAAAERSGATGARPCLAPVRGGAAGLLRGRHAPCSFPGPEGERVDPSDTSYPSEPPPCDGAVRRERRLRELPPTVLRPRDKLLRFGVRGLSHAELLAILLGTGVRGQNVITIAEDLVSKYGAASLPSLSLKDWARHRGV